MCSIIMPKITRRTITATVSTKTARCIKLRPNLNNCLYRSWEFFFRRPENSEIDSRVKKTWREFITVFQLEFVYASVFLCWMSTLYVYIKCTIPRYYIKCLQLITTICRWICFIFYIILLYSHKNKRQGGWYQGVIGEPFLYVRVQINVN